MIALAQAALMPSGLATLLLLAGVLLVPWRRARRLGSVLLAASAATFVAFSNGFVATVLLSPLEYAYPALQDPRAHSSVSYIVLLSAYATDDDSMPLSGRLNAASAFRVLEAANLHAMQPRRVILVTGIGDSARIPARQLLQLGIPADRLRIDAQSGNTAESAAYVRAAIGDQPVVLVTSAGHMARAVGVFRRQGLRPVPAPTDYLLPRSPWQASWTTSALHLQASDLAVHEYLGLAWYLITGRI